MESDKRQLEVELADHKVFLDKVKRISLEEEKKRFRSGLVTSALENNVAIGQIGDALVEILQKCLFDDDNEKKTLQSKLERVREMARSYFTQHYATAVADQGAPYFGLKKRKNRRRMKSRRSKRQKTAPPSLAQGLDPPLYCLIIDLPWFVLTPKKITQLY